MKFLQSALAIIILAAAFTSCEKQHLTAPAPAPVVPPVATPVSDIQTVIKFDGNLADSTARLTAASSGSVTYIADRKGNANGALHLDGTTSKVTYPGLVLQGKSMTISLWVKSASLGGGVKFYLSAMNGDNGPALFQVVSNFGTSVSIPNTNSSESLNSTGDGWHHYAVTYNGTDIKSYLDGTLTTKNHPGSIGTGARDLIIGWYHGAFCDSNIDDLRIYNVVLSDNEIKNLAAQ